MDRIKEGVRKYSDALKVIDEYKKAALRRLGKFYLAVYKYTPSIEPRIDKEAEARFPNAYSINREIIQFLAYAIYNENGVTLIESLALDTVRYKLLCNNIGMSLTVNSIIAYGDEKEFDEFLSTIQDELKAYLEYLKGNENIFLSDEEKVKFERYLELKNKGLANE